MVQQVEERLADGQVDNVRLAEPPDDGIFLLVGELPADLSLGFGAQPQVGSCSRLLPLAECPQRDSCLFAGC